MKRWLEPPVERTDGRGEERTKERRKAGLLPGVSSERYAGDVMAHCSTKAQAYLVLASIESSLKQFRLEPNGQKTRVV